MNHYKHKREKNLKKSKKEKYDLFINDPPDSKCPYCGKSKIGCSYINGLSRAWIRSACAKNNNYIRIDNKDNIDSK